ncbi:MAG: hypothetical protein ACQEQ0_14275, partial [Bacteroidota bacterium]
MEIHSEINLDFLSDKAQIWAKRYPDIERILFYQAASESKPYALVFELDSMNSQGFSGFGFGVKKDSCEAKEIILSHKMQGDHHELDFLNEWKIFTYLHNEQRYVTEEYGLIENAYLSKKCFEEKVIIESETELFPGKKKETDRCRTITGKQILDQKIISMTTLLSYLQQGLRAWTEYGDYIFNLDDDTTSQPALKGLQTQRPYDMNQLRREKGKSARYDLSPYAIGWKGISYTMPKSEKKEQQLKATIETLRFSSRDLMALLSNQVDEQASEAAKCVQNLETENRESTVKSSQKKQIKLSGTNTQKSIPAYLYQPKKEPLKYTKKEDAQSGQKKHNHKWLGTPIQKWEDIAISFISNEQVRVRTPHDDTKLT